MPEVSSNGANLRMLCPELICTCNQVLLWDFLLYQNKKVTADITHSRMVCKSNSSTIMIVEASALYKTSTVGQ